MRVLGLIVRAGEDISRDARRATIVHLLIAIEHVHTAILEGDSLLQTLLLGKEALLVLIRAKHHTVITAPS